jgi:undecaprenyl diphosphate synthase
VIGNLSKFDERLVRLIHESSKKTKYNQTLTLTIAANYGGRWDILQAVNRMLAEDSAHAQIRSFSEADLAPHLSMHFAPEPDLFIRSGGEQRVSNFLLWQLAYTELYFTDKLWPDFDASALDEAIHSYQRRERRFGHTSEQVRTMKASVPAAFGA